MITTIPGEAFWKLRAVISDRRLFEQQHAALVEKVRAAMTAAGLDPDKLYNLNDAELTATEQP